MMYDNLKRKNHCVYFICYHIIWVTKFRYNCLTQSILQDIIQTLPKMAETMQVKITEINGESDHIHFILELSPQDTLGNVVGALKSKSASYLKSKYKFPYWGKHLRTLWSSGYFAVSTGGAPLDVIKKYIQNQKS